MKVQLTERRRVEAEGRWFKAQLAEEQATINAPGIGRVCLRRTREGLQVCLFVEKEGEQFLEVEGTPPKRLFASDSLTVKLRPYGLVTMAEMDEPDLRTAVQIWINKEKK